VCGKCECHSTCLGEFCERCREEVRHHRLIHVLLCYYAAETM